MPDAKDPSKNKTDKKLCPPGANILEGRETINSKHDRRMTEYVRRSYEVWGKQRRVKWIRATAREGCCNGSVAAKESLGSAKT